RAGRTEGCIVLPPVAGDFGRRAVRMLGHEQTCEGLSVGGQQQLTERAGKLAIEHGLVHGWKAPGRDKDRSRDRTPHRISRAARTRRAWKAHEPISTRLP